MSDLMIVLYGDHIFLSMEVVYKEARNFNNNVKCMKIVHFS